MLVSLVVKAKAIPAETWKEHQAYMWEHFDNPEAEARFAAETEEILRRKFPSE